jgi:Zn-dependent protease
MGVVGVLILKLGAQLKFFIAPVLKFFPLLLKSGGTMFVSIWAYSMFWGWKYAAGFVLLILVHEMGHVMAARRFGVKATAPMFIPFMGAFIALQSAMKDALVEAEIGIAGPVWGSIGAALCHAAGIYFDMPLLLALAWTGYWLNLFNLTPVGQLDGGHVVQALSPWMQLLGFPVMLGLAIMRPSLIIFLLLAMSLPRLIALFRARTEAEQQFYNVPTAARWRMGLTYFGLIGLLVFGMYEVDLQLAHLRQ